MTAVTNPVEQLVHECEAAGVNRCVVLLHTEGDAAATAAMAAAEALDGHGHTRRHRLAPGLLAVWWQGDNPAWPGVLAALPGATTRAELFDLPGDAAALLRALPAPPAAMPARRGTPLDDDALRAMQAGLARADVSRFVRRSPVLRFSAAGPRLAWEKRFLHLPELTETLAPGHDAMADRVRLRLLCQTLDARMLRHLSDLQELANAGPFGVNLNVASLSTPEFARFDAVLPARLRGRVVLVLSPGDVLADPAAFAEARDTVGRAGFRFMLRGVSAALLPALAVRRMELDYLGLRWSRALDGHAPPAGAKVVLAGVDGPAALRWAVRHGVTLFAVPAAGPLRARHLDARHLDGRASVP